MSCHPRATCHLAKCCHLANSMSWSQSHVPHCRMLLPVEFNVMSSGTLQGVATCQILRHVIPEPLPYCRVLPTGEWHCHPRTACHLAACCDLANLMSCCQSHVSYCRVLLSGEFNVMSSQSHVPTLQGAAKWLIQCPDHRATYPKKIDLGADRPGRNWPGNPTRPDQTRPGWIKTRNLAIANISRVSCAHSTSRTYNSNSVTLKYRLEVTQSHWKWRHSIDRVPINVRQQLWRYLISFARYSDLVESHEICIFHLYFTPLHKVILSQLREDVWSGYVWWRNYDNMLSHFHTIPEHDRWTDKIPLSISLVSVLTRDKMYPLCNNRIWDTYFCNY